MTTNQERAAEVIGRHMDDADAQWALETIANMTVEVEYRIVPADSNGGKYETRRWARHVTEWRPDVAS